MSHATLTVKVTAKRLAAHGGDLDAALAEMLAPYEESPDHTAQAPSPFLSFVEDREADEDQMAGRRRGYWRNPNAKWDWWVVGGRWTGFYPVKSGTDPALGESGSFGNRPKAGRGDIVRLADLNWSIVEAETTEAVSKFWTEYQRLLAGEKFDAFDGPRGKALRLGLLDVVREPVTDRESAAQKVFSWAGLVSDDRRYWNDVAKIVERSAVDALAPSFNPIVTFAALDNDGWHEPGELGWFGCSSETPDARNKFCAEFLDRFVKSAASDDLLVVVDYHI